MDKRVRSPNYPSMGLKEAIEKITLAYRALQQHAAPREVVAKALGYNSLNGASATVISALNKYGLLEGRGEDLRVSERALSILHPHSDEERSKALRAAAVEPRLFADLAERFPGSNTNEELLKNYLLRNGFAINAVTSAIQAYRETSEFVEQELERYDSGYSPPKEAPIMQAASHPVHQPTLTPAPIPQPSDGSRLLHKYQLASGGFIEITIPRDLKPSTALRLIEASLPGLKAQLEIEEAERLTSESSATKEAGGKIDERSE